MVIVGLQCGHDASVAVVSNGKVLLHLERERVTRQRHTISMAPDLIHEALAYCGLTVADVDLFAVCTTQSAGYRSEDGARLTFAYDWEGAEAIGPEKFRKSVFERALLLAGGSDGRSLADGRFKLINSEWPDMADIWTMPRGMLSIDDLDEATLRRIFSSPDLRRSHVLPMRVIIDGHSRPAVGVMHQISHAAAAFYQSRFETAAVYAHDNGDPALREHRYAGGMLFHGEGTSLIPIWTAPVPAGLIYSRTSEWLGLGGFAGPGKLMGLAGYGTPTFFDQRFIGDIQNLADLYVNSKYNEWRSVYGWFQAVERRAEGLGYRFDEGAFSRFGKDLAASAQATFEELVAYALQRLRVLLERADRMTPNLCLSGGCALNCPTNSRVIGQTDFSSVFVPPSCDDGGLSIGAALYAYHHVLEGERVEAPPHSDSIAALGRAPSPQDIVRALTAASDEFDVETGVNLAESAAGDLALDRVVALFQGRSESGPRALGHRSLLADPRQAENWSRVNDLKSRERWRPFAPACLSERLRDHFVDGPEHSPHMLFNYRVRSRDLPAVTHVDGTARTQTVARGSGTFRDVIEAFDRRTGTPVVLNTSLNGPGEPIVETPEQALDFMRRTDTDVLYLENNRISRRKY